MARNFDCYDKAAANEGLEQGDFIIDCPIVIPTTDNYSEQEVIDTKVQMFDVVVMTQSCDLENSKIGLVMVCPFYSLEKTAESNPSYGSNEGKESLRRGNDYRLHMLNACTLAGFERDEVIVSFVNVYSIHLEVLKELVESRGGERLRLLPPYREQLAQAFAKFFMRVAPPNEIPTFNPDGSRTS